MNANLSRKKRLFCKILEIWAKSLRISHESPPPEPLNGIVAIWHKDLLSATVAFRGRGIEALISSSSDGDLMAAFAERFGYRVVRGSSSKDSLRVRRLLKSLRAGVPCAMALDGPKGPVGIEKPGTRWLAEKARAPVLRTEFRYSRKISLSSWDGAEIPLPFSKVWVRIHVDDRSCQSL